MLQTGSRNLLTSKLLVGFNDCLQLKSEWPEPLRFMPCINIKDSKRIPSIYINFCLPNDRRDEGIVAVVHPGEEVVLDLVVEPTVQLAEPPAANVGRGDNLQALRVF